MNNNKNKQTKQYLAWDYHQERAISKDILNKISKFHQFSSTVHFPNSTVRSSESIKMWTRQVEGTDILPNYYDDTYKLKPIKNNIKGSNWIFDKDYTFSNNEISNILYSAFGRDSKSKSKNYPSAGSLNSIFTVIYVLSDTAIEGSIKMGVYVFDPEEVDLKLIKRFDKSSIKTFRKLLTKTNDLPSNLVIGYAMDLKRAITKYRARGYRFSLIEVGLMAQSLKLSLREEGDFGELCWGGFSDNALTYFTGLNVKMSPITLLQWFGKRGV